MSLPLEAQLALSALALLTGLYAGFDLVFRLPDWRRDPLAVVARGWLFVVLVVVGVEEIVFGTNALLLIGYRLRVPLVAIQVFALGSIVAASLVWSRD